MTHRRTSYDEEDSFEIIETLGHSAAKQDFHCGQEFREVTSEFTFTLCCRENIGRHTWAVVLKFFVERTDFTKSQMSTKKQLNITVNNKQRN